MSEPSSTSDPPRPDAGSETRTTRRAFVRRAVYVAPSVLVLTRQATAAQSCLPFGSPCTFDVECCSGVCGTGSMCKMA